MYNPVYSHVCAMLMYTIRVGENLVRPTFVHDFIMKQFVTIPYKLHIIIEDCMICPGFTRHVLLYGAQRVFTLILRVPFAI